MKFQTEKQPWFINFQDSIPLWLMWYEVHSNNYFWSFKQKTTRLDISDLLQESMISYHCDLCDTKFISKQPVFEVHQKENKPWIKYLNKPEILHKHDSIPSLWHMWYEIRFNSYSFEIQKKETRLEFSSEILLIKTISINISDEVMFLYT